MKTIFAAQVDAVDHLSYSVTQTSLRIHYQCLAAFHAADAAFKREVMRRQRRPAARHRRTSLNGHYELNGFIT